MRSFFIFIFYFATASCLHAQSTQPIFRSSQDSIRYYTVDSRIKAIFETDNPDKQEVDSLLKAKTEIMSKGIRGYHYVYYPNDTFIQYKDLAAEEIEVEEVNKLSISDYHGKHLPLKILQCRNLEELELINTNLERLPRKLDQLTKLREIRIYNNNPSKKLKLAKNKHVAYLQIRGDKPEKLPSSYKNFKALDSLDLSRNLLEKFPGINHNKKLRQLVLTDNNLTLVKLSASSTLENLLLHKNKITAVPASIGNFTNLKKVIFSFNNITEVAPEVSKLKKLEYLSFYQNKLIQIPQGVFQLRNLKSIDLYFNQIEKIDDEIGQLGALEVLYLSNNKITKLPESLGSLTKLRELYLHHNRLSYLPESIQQLKELRVLRINENFITDFPTSILTLEKLENLDLSSNELLDLPESFYTLNNLKIVGLTQNPWENPERISALVKALEKSGVLVHVNAF